MVLYDAAPLPDAARCLTVTGPVTVVTSRSLYALAKPPTAPQVAPPLGAASPMRFGAKSASPATTPLAGGALRIFRTLFEDGAVRRRSPCRTRLFVCPSCPRCRSLGVTYLKSLRIVLRLSQRVVCRSRSRSKRTHAKLIGDFGNATEVIRIVDRPAF
jgi:hypothetical protein